MFQFLFNLAMAGFTLWFLLEMKKWHDRKKKEFVIDVDSMVLHHMEMISHLSLTKFKQFGRGCVLVTAPYTKFGAACNYGLTHIKTEAGAVKDDVDVVVDYVAERQLKAVTARHYKPQQFLKVAKIVKDYDPEKELVIIKLFPRLPIRTIVLSRKEVEKSEDEMDVVLDEAKASLMAFIEKIKKKAGVKGTESSEKTTAEKQD